MPSRAFYCVSDADHYVGLVALINSLRLVGHDDPFFVVDAGLTPSQRTSLAGVAETVLAADPLPPMLLKAAGPIARPAEVMIVLDADVIVLRRLDELINLAASGRVVAFTNDQPDRHFPEWGELFGGIEPRRQPYVASGHLFVGGTTGRRFIDLFHDAQQRLDLGRTLLGNEGLVARITPADPFYYPDMDALNALLTTVMRPDELYAAEYRLAPHAPFGGLRLLDTASLSARYDDGAEPMLLHHVLAKPWLAATRRNAYSLLLPRLLLAEDLAIRLDPSAVPLRLRTGLFAEIDRLRADVQATLRARLRGRLGLRPKLAAWRDRRRAPVGA